MKVDESVRKWAEEEQQWQQWCVSDDITLE